MLPAILWSLQLPLLLLLTSAWLLWKYSTRKFDYWKKRGVYHPKPTPLLGNLADVIFLKKFTGDWIASLYSSTDERYFGIFAFDEPILVLKDPKLIQHVMIKDASKFTDRSVATPHDKVASSMMFFQKSPEWKMQRSKITTTFSSGKIKAMFHLINSIGEDLVEYLERKSGVILEGKEFSGKYSTNVIAKCAFGIDANSFQNEDADFRNVSRAMFDFSWRNAGTQLGYFFRQQWMETLHLDFFRQDLRAFLGRVFSETMKLREKGGERVNDFVDLLVDLRNAGQLSHEAACGQAIMFFVGGFETTSASVSYTLHELCLNKEIQNKVRREIMDAIAQHGGISYEAVQEMKYLRVCVSETLRKYPVLPFLDRRCNERYELPDTDLVIEEGMSVYVPLAGLHMDENYFPEPHKYNPDRFLKKNYNQEGLVYLPFGSGPRSCVGERFGLLSTQLALIHVLLNFEVEKCAKSPDPVEFEPKSIVTQSKVGLPMILKKFRGMQASSAPESSGNI